MVSNGVLPDFFWIGQDTNVGYCCLFCHRLLLLSAKNGPTIRVRLRALPIRWQKSTTLQRVPDTSMRLKIIYISVQGKHSKLWGAWRGVLDYIEIICKNNWSSTSMDLELFRQWGILLFLFYFNVVSRVHIWDNDVL